MASAADANSPPKSTETISKLPPLPPTSKKPPRLPASTPVKKLSAPTPPTTPHPFLPTPDQPPQTAPSSAPPIVNLAPRRFSVQPSSLLSLDNMPAPRGRKNSISQQLKSIFSRDDLPASLTADRDLSEKRDSIGTLSGSITNDSWYNSSGRQQIHPRDLSEEANKHGAILSALRDIVLCLRSDSRISPLLDDHRAARVVTVLVVIIVFGMVIALLVKLGKEHEW